MSGGSHNNLYIAQWVDGLCNRQEDMEHMAASLRELGYEKAAEHTLKVLNMLALANEQATLLENVWHAVEWYDSGDYNEKAVAEAIERYETTLADTQQVSTS